jgi:hypothetical protein
MFPFLTGGRTADVRRIHFFFETCDARPGRSHVLDLLPARHYSHTHHGDEGCDCETTPITCVASNEFPCLFHGVVDVHPGLLDARRYTDVGVLRFRRHSGPFRRAFMVCAYRATPLDGCGRAMLRC